MKLLKERMFPNKTKQVILRIYFAMESKFYGLKYTDPDLLAIKFLKNCEIQKVRKHLFSNNVDIWLMRPGIFIGKAGCDIDCIQKFTGYKINLHECKKYFNPVQEAISNL